MSHCFEWTRSPKRVFSEANQFFRLGVWVMVHMGYGTYTVSLNSFFALKNTRLGDTVFFKLWDFVKRLSFVTGISGCEIKRYRMSMLKNANFAKNGRRPIQIKYSFMSNQSTPDFCLCFSLGPFFHTTLIVDMRWTIIAEVQIYLRPALPPPPKKRGYIWWSTPLPQNILSLSTGPIGTIC